MSCGPRSIRPLLPLILCLCSVPAVAWAPATRVRQVDEAVRLMPASLRIALERSRTSLLRGALEPLTREDEPGHRPSRGGPGLEQELDREVTELIALLQQPRAFDRVAEGFGRVAHFVADGGFPPGVGNGDEGSRYAHFASFCESRRGRFPVVFYGHDDARLGQQGDYTGYIQDVIERARREDLALARAYAAAGDPPSPSAFDDRSIPFAVGALTYSHTITDIARVWLALWRQAGGDVAGTPYSDPTRPTLPQENVPDAR